MANFNSARAWWTIAGVCVAGLILWGSLFSPPVGIHGVDRGDLVLHFLAYGCLGGWFTLLSRNNKEVVIAVAILMIYAAGLEILQTYFPPRVSHISDFIASTLGIFIGALGARLIVLPTPLGRLVQQ